MKETATFIKSNWKTLPIVQYATATTGAIRQGTTGQWICVAMGKRVFAKKINSKTR